LLFSAVISEHFSENRMIISLVAAKIWYPEKCAVFFWATLYIYFHTISYFSSYGTGQFSQVIPS